MSKLSFESIDKSILPHIAEHYMSLVNPLADLNAVMMAAWRSVLNLRYCIDKDKVLYIIGFFEDKYWGWGPPIGHSVKNMHINYLFDALEELNSKPSSILYLWEEYPLWSTLQKDPLYSVSMQASEYIYLSQKVASLPYETMKSLSKKKKAFCRKQKPTIQQYSTSLADDCLLILEKWFKQKKVKVPEAYLDKFRIETDVCSNAIKESLPLSGVVAYINGSPVGFSLGGEHSKSCFNCMFEKTDLSYDGLSVFIFSELGEMLKNKYKLINAGEDWGIPYLKETKLKWQPMQIKNSYQLYRNEI